MIPPVYYLSLSPAGDGLVFPTELPVDYYSPGLFVLEEAASGTPDHTYSFTAMQGSREIETRLVPQEGAGGAAILYVVKTQHFGPFVFRAMQLDPHMPYAGSFGGLRSHAPLWALLAMDRNKLERVCRRFDFYFVGANPIDPFGES